MIANPALAALLASGVPLYIADCYTITLLDGTVLRYTGADVPLGLFRADGPVISRGSVHLTRGLEVSTLDVTLGCGQTVFI